MKIVTIDLLMSRFGTCRVCLGDRTVYPVKREDGSWTWSCKPCAGNAGAMK